MGMVPMAIKYAAAGVEQNNVPEDLTAHFYLRYVEA
jgi:hypothetical protein